ncbi:MAG: co-chaperone GroES [Parachlamydiaceae bacterium]|nr:co-chaperone GroES [Parachlamydiaceae bacterium]
MPDNQPKIKPLGNRVLVERSKPQSSKGGILLPDSAQEKPKEGVVIAIGPGKMNEQGQIETMNLKIGDRVLFSSYSGTEIKQNEEEGKYLILSEEDVLGVLTH